MGRSSFVTPQHQARLKSPRDSELLKNLRKADAGSFTAPSPIDGIERIIGFAKVHAFPVYAIYSIDKNAIVLQWLRGIAPGALIALLAALCLLSPCWLALRSAEQQRLSMHALDDANRKLGLEMESRARAEASLIKRSVW